MLINELCLCFAIITCIGTLDWLRLVWQVYGLSLIDGRLENKT
jgi:hypothetical protein